MSFASSPESILPFTFVGNGRRRRASMEGTELPWGTAEADPAAERKSHLVHDIAQEKALVGAQHLTPDSVRPAHVLAGDIMPYIEHQGRLTPFWKPKDLAEVQKNFSLLSETGYKYRSRSSTAHARVESDSTHFSGHGLEIQVDLNPHVIDYIATDKGFATYVETFRTLNNDAFTLHNVAGGFCLEALIAMDSVDALNGVSLRDASVEDIREAILDHDSELFQALYGALYTVICTVAPHALAEVMSREETTSPGNSLPEIVDRLSDLEDITHMTITLLRSLETHKLADATNTTIAPSHR